MLLSSLVARLAKSVNLFCLCSLQTSRMSSVFQPSRRLRAATTRSWDFLDLNYQMPNDLLNKGRYGADIIIGVVDSGICPESRSFSDEG